MWEIKLNLSWTSHNQTSCMVCEILSVIFKVSVLYLFHLVSSGRRSASPGRRSEFARNGYG